MKGERNRLSINMVMQILAFAINVSVNFFLTPFIVNRLSTEVYGFVGFANNIINYVTIFTIAINGMLGRFVTIELSKKNYENSKKYFATVTIANIVISLVLLIPSVFFCMYCDKIINISPQYAADVKLLFMGIFISFLITIAGSSFSVSTYATNRLDLSSRRQTENVVLRALLLIALFTIFNPHVYFMGIASVICSIHILLTNKKYLKKYLPELKITRKYFRWNLVKELITAGIWNSINRLSSVLMTGLDLLITNLFINPQVMGLMSIGKSLPSYIMSFYSMVANVFSPRMTMLYGKGEMDALIKETKFAMYLCGFFAIVPNVGLIVFGESFYRLWLKNLPASDITQIQILSVLALFPCILSAFVYPLYNINTITLKLKIPVMVSLTMGVMNTLIVLILLNVTDFGVYAVAGVSSCLTLCRILFFVPGYAAANLKIKWYSFYPQIFHGIVNFIILYILFTAVKNIVVISSWKSFITVILICGISGYIISALVLFNKNHFEMIYLSAKKRMILFGKGFRKYIRNHIDRKRIKNKDFTIISNNCISGIISNDLNLKFLSPTVNLYIEPHDFVKFLSNMEFYLEQPIIQIESHKDYPMGKLNDIILYFKHYDSFESGVEKWNIRKQRINYDNIFVIMTDRFYCSYNDALQFSNLPYKNKILLISDDKDWSDIPCSIKMKKYNDKKTSSVGVITDIVNIFGKRMYQQSGFDYIKWLNSPEKFMENYKKKYK